MHSCTVQLIASYQKLFGIFFSEIILRTIFIIVLFFRSVSPFCRGVFVAVSCLCIPFTSQKLVNSCDVNSPPRSVRKALINEFISFST